MTDTTKEKSQDHFSLDHDLLDLAQCLNRSTNEIFKEFNARRIRLFDLPASQRIFLFILTRAKKTYGSILLLCQNGFGQDVSTLVRTLLENFVAARYILFDAETANHKAARFVDYKWIILKRQLAEQEKDILDASEEEKKRFLEKQEMVIKRAQEFKTKYHVVSDRALITWSGKSLRDMAKKVDPELLKEYETTFRLCSRFSHPSILGDNEYLVMDDKYLVFSPHPTLIGVIENLQSAIKFMINFLKLTIDIFELRQKDRLEKINEKYEQLIHQPLPEKEGPPATPQDHSIPNIRESIVLFKTDPER